MWSVVNLMGHCPHHSKSPDNKWQFMPLSLSLMTAFLCLPVYPLSAFFFPLIRVDLASRSYVLLLFSLFLDLQTYHVQS